MEAPHAQIRGRGVRRGLVTAALVWMALASTSPLNAQAVPSVRVIEQPDGPLVERHWTARSGLPVNQITGMIQGSDGYLWLSTFDGLVRFDGVRFTLFNKGRTPTLPSARFSEILGESDGLIWLRSEAAHLIAFDGDEFQDHTPALEGSLIAFYLDHSGEVWVGTTTGLFRFEGGQWIRSPLGEGGGVSTMLQAGPGLFLIARTGGAIQRYFVPSERLETIVTLTLDRQFVQRLAEDDEGALWGASNSSAYRIRPDSVEVYPVGSVLGWPIRMIPPRFGQGPVLQMEGADLRLEQGRWVPMRLGDPDVSSIPAILTEDDARWQLLEKRVLRNGRVLSDPRASISHVLIDSEGAVWGAGTTGLYQFRPVAVESLALDDAGDRYEAYALHEGASGSLWVAATGPGVLSGLWRVQDREAELVIKSPSPAFPERIEMAVLEDRRGDLWVAMGDGGVCRLRGFRCMAAGYFPLNGERVRAIHEARDGTLWFGTTDALYRLDPAGTWLRLGPDDGLPEVTVRAIAETPEGHLWLGTQLGGVLYWDGRVFHQISYAEGLPTNAVRGLYLDSAGMLWVGTEGLGLSRVERVGDLPDGSPEWRISTVRQANGLFDDGIHQIVEDTTGRFWMSSNRGLFFVHRADLEGFLAGTVSQVRSTKFDERDGLLNRELNGGVHGAGLMLRDRRIVFSGMGGLAVVRPDGGKGGRPPPVRVEEVRVGGQRLVVDSGTLRLPRGNRDLEITFTGLSFWMPETMGFRYRLRGLDTEWREVVGIRSAFYTNLSGGRYIFEVQASNEPGVWSPVPDTLSLIIPHHPHEHPLAQAGFGVFVLLGLVGMVRLRERQLRLQAQQLEHVVQERTEVVESQAARLLEMDRMKSRLFEDISHELRTPLTLIVAPLEGVRDGLSPEAAPAIRRDVDVALQNSKRLLDLVAQILDVARLEAGRLPVRVSALDASAWIRHLILAFSPLAEQKGVRLRTEIAEDLPVLWSSPDLFQKMLGNLISNAIKFTPSPGVVRVRSWASGTQLFIEVRDSGPGIPAEQIPALFQRFSESFSVPGQDATLPSTRIGLSLANQLAELHGGGIEVRSEEGFGATFLLSLKLGRDHLPDDVEVDDSSDPLPRRPDSEPGAPPRDSAQGLASSAAAMPQTASEDHPELADAPRVLVVEDHPDVRAYLEVLLGGTYRVRTATHGKEALAIIKTTPPDLVVSDLRMPEMDGLALLAAIRAQDRDRVDGLMTPFFLVSAHDDSMDRATAYRMGASDFILKPFSPKDLLARISGLLASQTLLEQRRPVIKVSASEVSVESASATFLAKLAQVVEDHLGDPDFGATQLAKALGYSRSGLYRKLEDVGEASPAQILQRMRLDRAAQLLAEGAGSVSRIGFQCGFRTVSHFSRAFKAQFGVSPSQYLAPASTGTQRQVP